MARSTFCLLSFTVRRESRSDFGQDSLLHVVVGKRLQYIRDGINDVVELVATDRGKVDRTNDGSNQKYAAYCLQRWFVSSLLIDRMAQIYKTNRVGTFLAQSSIR